MHLTKVRVILIIVVNKWDIVDKDDKTMQKMTEKIKTQMLKEKGLKLQKQNPNLTQPNINQT